MSFRKSRPFLLAAVALGPISSPSGAAVIYWDGGSTNIPTNGDGVSQGGSGTWLGFANWDYGNGVAHSAWNKRHTASFGGPSGTVTAGALSAAGLVFTSDNYVISGSGVITVSSGGITANGSTTLSAPLALKTSQSWAVAAGKVLTVGGAVNTGNGRLLTIAGSGNTAISGVISGSGGLTKTGSGLLTLTGANTFTGTTTIAGGILNLGSSVSGTTSGPLGKPTSTAGTLLLTGGTLQYSAANTSDYSSRFSTAGGQIWSIDTNAQNVTYATGMSGASSLAKIGTGTLNLSSASSYTGGTTISAGTLNVTGSLADTGAVTVSGGTYTVGSNDTIGVLTLASGTISGSGTLSAASYSVQSGAVGAILGGSGALAKSTAGTVTLSGNNTYTGGTTISAGILNVTGSLANAGAVTVSGGTYTVGISDTIGALTLASGSINGTGTLTASSYSVQSGTISANLAGLGIGLTKSTGSLVTLSGTHSYTGPTAVNAGILTVNGSLHASSAVSVADGATLSGFGTVAGTVNAAANATIRADPALGTFVLGGLNFAGAGTIGIGSLSTTVSALSVSGALTLGGGAGQVSLALPVGALAAGSYSLITTSFTDLGKFSVTGAAPGVRQTAGLVSSGGVISYQVQGANPYWTGALGSEWSTATLAAPKNWAISPTQTTDFLTGDAVLFDDRATGTTVALAASVSPNVVSFTNATKNYLLQGSGGIAAGMLTKSGAGALTITNANTYAGGTVLYSGILRVGNDAAFGTGGLTLESGRISSDSSTARTLANAVTINGNLTLGDATDSGSLTFSGGVNLSGFTRELATPSNVTFSGIVSNGALVKSGAGILTLSGANTYSGGTVLTAGTLAVSSASSLGSGSVTFAGNSAIQFNASYALSRGYTANSGVTATLNTNGFDLTHSGVITGAGSLQKSGAGNLTLSGTNTHLGTTTISGGTLTLSGGTAIPDQGAVVLANTAGATFRLASAETIGSLSGGGASGGLVDLQSHALTVAGATDTTYAGVVSGSGSLVKTGAATFTLSGANTHTGSTTINGGTVRISADSGLGTVPGTATAGRLILSGGTLATTATFTLAANRGITTGGTLDVASGTTLTYGGIAAGTGILVKTGTGTLALTGANTYTGATSVMAGNLAVNGSLAATAVTVNGDAILSGSGTIGGSVTAQDNAILRAGNGSGGSLRINGSLDFTADATIEIGTLSNYVSNNPAIRVIGNVGSATDSLIVFSLPAGLLSNNTYNLLSHANNITNNELARFSVTGPTLNGRQSGVLASSSGVINYVVAGDTPYWTGTTSSQWATGDVNWRLLTAGTATSFLANDLVLFNDLATNTTVNIAANVDPVAVTFDHSSKNYTLQGTAGIATGSLTKSGTGTLTVTNANTYTGGTTLQAGVLRVGNNQALGVGNVSLNGGTLSSDSTTARTLANGFTVGGDVTLGNATDSGALTLSGPVGLGGGTRQVTTASDVTLSGVVSNGGLTKAGPAILTMTGANTYTGATQVNAGKLVVNGSLANASLVVASGATLGGSGTIAGATTVQSGAIHAPGNSPGTQSFADLSYAEGSIFSWEIDRTAAQTRGTGYDAVNVSGLLSGSGAIFRIVIGDSDFSDTFWHTPRTWTDIFTGADGSTASQNWAAIFSGGFQFYNTAGSAIGAPPPGGFTLTGNTLAWSAVPEPGSALAGILLAAGLLRRRRQS